MGSEEKTEPAQPRSEALRTADREASVVPLVVIGVVASVIGIAFGLLIDWFPVQASSQAEDIDTFYDVLVIASVPMFVLVTAVVLYCVWRFRMRPGEENMDGPPIHGNTRLEVIWTLIPAVMMLGLCTWAWIVLNNAEEAPAAAQEELKVRVVGEQFAWTFHYPGEGGGEEARSDQLYLPINRSVRFTVQSKDVLHDFWVPAFRWKIDAVPGINTYYRVTPTRIGRYPIVCAELCGLGHATMRQTAHVLPEGEFEDWLTELRAGTAEGQGGGAAEGEVDGQQVFTATGCGACHVLADAGASGATGPNLDETLADKDAAYIEEAIVDPNAVLAEGYQAGIMPPNYESQLSPEELDALVKYLEETTG